MADIITLSGKYKTTKDLILYCDAQYVALNGSIEKIKKLEDEVKHLQELLASTTPLIGDSKVEILLKSPELTICEIQIELLQNRAMQKELSLEEVKTLDLLIKNKRLLSGDPSMIESDKKKTKPLTKQELVAVARIEKKNE